MIVFHGSSETVYSPDVEHSFRNLDFGKGFYVTPMTRLHSYHRKQSTDALHV